MADKSEPGVHEVQALLYSFIRCGTVQKLKFNPQTNQIEESHEADADIPWELHAILQEMPPKMPQKLSGTDGSMIAHIRHYDQLHQQLEDGLTPKQKKLLAEVYKNLQQAANKRDLNEAAEPLKTADKIVQDIFEKQQRLRQSLASHVMKAWRDCQSRDEEKTGEEENGNQANESENKGSDGQEPPSRQDPDSYGDQGMRPEDSPKGLQQWLAQLEQQTLDVDKKTQQEAEAAAGTGGEQPIKTGEPKYNLSSEEPCPQHVKMVREALQKLLMRTRNNPTSLPRWDMRELGKRMMTHRPLKPAKKPTLEHHAIVFIIDNSGSMGSLEKASRAFAAALAKASDPHGPDIIVATSFNGNFINNAKQKRAAQAECWFWNGTYMGFLPEPTSVTKVNKLNQGECWQWFICEQLRHHGVHAKMVVIFGDNNGAFVWSYLSNAVKHLTCLWFNPADENGKNTPGKIMLEKNPYMNGRENTLKAKTHASGDSRFERFRGLLLLRIRSASDIVKALKRHARL